MFKAGTGVMEKNMWNSIKYKLILVSSVQDYTFLEAYFSLHVNWTGINIVGLNFNHAQNRASYKL